MEKKHDLIDLESRGRDTRDAIIQESWYRQGIKVKKKKVKSIEMEVEDRGRKALDVRSCDFQLRLVFYWVSSLVLGYWDIEMNDIVSAHPGGGLGLSWW